MKPEDPSDAREVGDAGRSGMTEMASSARLQDAEALPAWTLDHLALMEADVGAWTWSIEQDVVRWSPRAFELFNAAGDSFAGTLTSLLAHVHPEDRPTVNARIRRALEQGPDTWSLEHRVAGAHPERWIRQRGRLIRDEAGKAIRMSGVAELVDAQAPERELQDHTVLMQAALDASLFAVVVLDPSGSIIYCNNLAATLLGLTPSAVRSRGYDAPQWKHSDVNGGPWPEEKQPFARVMATGMAVYGIEHRIERPDGAIKTLRINGAPIKNERGEIKLVVCSFEDVTERRAVEDGFRRAQKMEAVGRLAAGVAHDFNNLLTVIMSCACLAQTADDRTQLLDYLSNIVDACDRAAALTGQLLMFTRKDIASAEVFDVRDEVTVSARLIERVVGERISVRLEDYPEPCWARMDRGLLHQVLVNLAVNARDAMPNGGSLTIATRRAADARRVRIVVSDTGSGMDAVTQQRVFEPFFTTKPKHKGTGLGLSTCHGIVTGAGGTIALSSAPTRGTSITIELPLADEPPAAAPAGPKPARRPSGLRRRVLIVEDEPAVRLLAMQALREAHFEVSSVATAEQALELLASRRFDLLVSDVILPGMTGVELAQRAHGLSPQLVVLLVSGYAGDTGLIDEQVLAKPYTPEGLLAAIDRAVAAHEAAHGE